MNCETTVIYYTSLIINLDLRSYLTLATTRLSVDTLDQGSLGIISNVITLFNIRAGQSVLDNFNHDQIDTMIVYLSTDLYTMLLFNSPYFSYFIIDILLCNLYCEYYIKHIYIYMI